MIQQLSDEKDPAYTEGFQVQISRGTWCVLLPSHPDLISLRNTKKQLLGANFIGAPARFIVDFSNTKLLDRVFFSELINLMKIFELLGAHVAVCSISPALGAAISLLDLAPEKLRVFQSLDTAIAGLKSSFHQSVL